MLSGDESSLLGYLDCLSPPARVELHEQPRGVRLYGILAHEQLFGDLTSTQPSGDERQDLVLAGRNTKRVDARLIGDEWLRVAHDDDLPNDFRGSGELEAEPDAEPREERGDETAVQLEGMLDDEVAVFDELEDRDQDAAEESIDPDGFPH